MYSKKGGVRAGNMFVGELPPDLCRSVIGSVFRENNTILCGSQ